MTEENTTPLTPEKRRDLENVVVLGGKDILVQRIVKNQSTGAEELVNDVVTVRQANSLREYFRAYAAFEDFEEPFAVARFFIKWKADEDATLSVEAIQEKREDYLESLLPESVERIEEVAREINFQRVSRYVEPRLARKEKQMMKNLEMMEAMPKSLMGQASDAFTQALRSSLDSEARKNGQKKSAPSKRP